MLVTTITLEYLPEWLKLAKKMGSVFQSPMAEDKKFREFISKRMERHEAIMAIDRGGGNPLMGVIAFSRSSNSISWFAVYPESQNRGVGSVLLACALNQLDKKKDISVITFREGETRGISARHIYCNYGFVEVDGSLFHHGQPRCLMKKLAEPESV